MGIMPSEFWRMTPSEFDVIWQASKPQTGMLSDYQREALEELHEKYGDEVL